MKALPLVDHTDRFNLYLRHMAPKPIIVSTDAPTSAPTPTPISVSTSTPKIKPTDRIDQIISLIDQEIGKIVKINTMFDRFSPDMPLEQYIKDIKSSVDNINMMSNSAMKLIKTYEETDKLIFRHYILIIKEKLQKTEHISSEAKRFQSSDIMSDLFTIPLTDPASVSEPLNSGPAFATPASSALSQSLLTDDHLVEMTHIVSQREQSINELARSMIEVHQQFVDLQIMIAMQGEKIAHIDANVFKSLDYVESGTKDLGIATTHHDKANSTKRKIVGTLIGAGAIAGIITYGVKKIG
jgi:hypothetical protein